MTKFNGQLSDFTLIELAIARKYPGWTMKHHRKITQDCFTILAHGEARYTAENLKLICQLMGIDLAKEKEIRTA